MRPLCTRAPWGGARLSDDGRSLPIGIFHIVINFWTFLPSGSSYARCV
jgi:hypothetical protein